MMFHLLPDYPSDSSTTGEWPEDKRKSCNAPRISIGFNPKGSSDLEPAKSPTCPLDIKTFSGIEITGCRKNSFDSQLGSPKQQSDTRSSTKDMNTHCGMECETVQYTVQKQNEHEIWDVASPPPNYSNVPVFSVAHFLSACYLCKRQLNHRKDIYMYRGDIAFCSAECRYQQILMDDGMLLPTDFDG